MPELPEVETVRRTLKNFILGRKITKIEIRYPKIIEGNQELFVQKVTDQTFRDIERYGKYLIFLLDDCAFSSHLRMEGKYNIVPAHAPYAKHDHVIFHLDDGHDLRYHDTRKFGRMALVSPDHYRTQPPFDRLGSEPWEASYEALYDCLHHKQIPIKHVLLDQSLLCGIGNIYANEICFRMGIDPRTKASRLSKKRVKQLCEVAQVVLQEAIDQGGTTIHSFDANGIHGLFQVELKVHGQKECQVCHTPVKKIMIQNRGTYFCPVCQKRRY